MNHSDDQLRDQVAVAPRKTVIELQELNHRYESSLVLSGLNLTIEAGEIFGFLGHNGAGKTTAINILTTLIRPTSGTAKVCGFDVVTENYYAKLSSGFTIPAGGKRTAHFDNTGQPDHFPVNKFSLYYVDKNALEVTVMVSASNSATQTTSLKKDAGGPEAAD
jgi:ABC-type cobalamin/Fe3+-siderophores transport system ATPase subunit